jgi:hypothetical protein
MRYDTDDDQYEWVTNTDGRRVRVLRDGGITRVPLQMMDATQRAIYNAVHDGSIEKLRQLRDEAYREREQQDQESWRGDDRYCPSCGFNLSEGSNLMRAGGDEIDDAACNPHSKHFDLDAAKAVRAQLYQDIADEQANSWKKGK